MSEEFKMPGNVITTLKVNHRPGKENALEGISEPRFFKQGVKNANEM